MDDNTAAVVIAAIGFLGTTIAATVTAVFSYLSLKASKVNTAKLEVLKGDVRTIEIATNSMKDELVKVTAEASFAAGSEEARKAGEQKAEVLAAERREPPK